MQEQLHMQMILEMDYPVAGFFDEFTILTHRIFPTRR